MRMFIHMCGNLHRKTIITCVSCTLKGTNTTFYEEIEYITEAMSLYEHLPFQWSHLEFMLNAQLGETFKKMT